MIDIDELRRQLMSGGETLAEEDLLLLAALNVAEAALAICTPVIDDPTAIIYGCERIKAAHEAMDRYRALRDGGTVARPRSEESRVAEWERARVMNDDGDPVDRG